MASLIRNLWRRLTGPGDCCETRTPTKPKPYGPPCAKCGSRFKIDFGTICADCGHTFEPCAHRSVTVVEEIGQKSGRCNFCGTDLSFDPVTRNWRE